MESVILIEGRGVQESRLMISLMNAKQIVLGWAGDMGIIVHVAATSPADLTKALMELAQVPGVTGVMTLALRAL